MPPKTSLKHEEFSLGDEESAMITPEEFQENTWEPPRMSERPLRRHPHKIVGGGPRGFPPEFPLGEPPLGALNHPNPKRISPPPDPKEEKNQKRNFIAKILCYQSSTFASKRLPKQYSREELQQMTVVQLETIHETNYDSCSSTTMSLLSNKLLIMGAVMAEQIPTKIGIKKFGGLAQNIISDPEIAQLWELITIEHLDIINMTPEKQLLALVAKKAYATYLENSMLEKMEKEGPSGGKTEAPPASPPEGASEEVKEESKSPEASEDTPKTSEDTPEVEEMMKHPQENVAIVTSADSFVPAANSTVVVTEQGVVVVPLGEPVGTSDPV